jgi:hypothetical protein
MPSLDHNWETFGVDPARLPHGSYCHESEQEIGEGDIVGSYSADRIAESDLIRKPFPWKGNLWVCVSIQGSRDGGLTVMAYRLTPAISFGSEPTTYRRKSAIEDGDYARNDPQGFYHGMTVKYAGESMVLTGPPAVFVADETQRAAEQLVLFG